MCTFILKDNNLYIYISEVASHHKYLVNNAQVDVMLTADQADSIILLRQNGALQLPSRNY